MFADSGRSEQEAVSCSDSVSKFYTLTDQVVYRGLASTIFHGLHRGSFLQVAVKVLMKRSFDSDSEYRNALGEVELHKALPANPNIIRLLDSEETSDAILLVTPYTPHGDLWSLTMYSQTYCEAEVRLCAAQMLAALRHLHSVCGVVHCDIKPHNFLLFRSQGRFSVQLIDFGLAEQPGADGLVAWHGVRGTSGWYAPEMLAHEDYGYPVDLFGIGLIVFRMLGGYQPFDPPSAFRSAVDFDDRCWCHVGPPCRHFIQRLLSLPPADRGTAAQACEHAWASGPPPPEPTAEQLQMLCAFGPPPSTDVKFWPPGEVPEPHLCNSYLNLAELAGVEAKDDGMYIDSDGE